MRTLERIERIAVLRANGIGDLMFALPALDALRAAYPAARITLLGAPWHRELLEGRPGPVDEVVVVPTYPGVREETAPAPTEELERFFEEMRRRSFDLAIQMHGGGANSNPFLLRLGARVNAGMSTPEAPRLDYTLHYAYYQHEVMRLLELVGMLGAPPVALESRLAVTERDLAAADAAVPRDDLPLVALNPGASDPRRRWSPVKLAAVGDRLGRAGAKLVVIGGPGDGELGRAVLQSMQHEAVDLVGKLDLGGLSGLLSRCRVVVSNDSGPLHVAAAVGAATVGIYWCGNLINAGHVFRGRHRPQLSWRLECPRCGASCITEGCSHEDSFVDEVAVDEVAGAALDLLAAPPALGRRHLAGAADPRAGDLPAS